MASRGVKRFSFVVALALLILSCSSNLRAQLPTGDIIGTVTDASGAALPGAHVTVTNTGTGEMRAADSGGSGDFAFTLLQLGNYTVTVEAKGFKKLTAAAVTLASGDRARVDAKMEVGDVTQTVEVAGVAPALQTDTSTIGGTITEQAVQDIPLNGRNFINLAQIAPGASEGNPQGFGTGTRPDDRRQSSQITVNAQNDSVNNKTIDGMDNNEAVIGTIGVQPSIDAIQEVRVQTNLYTAEVGRTAGAAVDIVTKSGANNFHGSAYEFFRNDKFDARSYFDTAQVGPKPKLRQNQFGGSLGGPIRKNKTFFFGDYEGQRVVQGLAVPIATVPTNCEQGLGGCPVGPQQLGNFSDLCKAGFNASGVCTNANQTIYNPATGVAYTNNVINTPISQVAKNLAALYPTANLPGVLSSSTGQISNNFGSTPIRTQYSTTFDGRVDHHFTENDTLSGRYTVNDIATQTPGNFPAVTVAGLKILPGGDINPSVNAFAGGNAERAQNAAIVYTRIISPNVVLQANLGYLRVAIFSTPLNYQTNAAQAFGFQGVNVSGVANGFATGLPFIQLSGYSNIGDDNFVPLKYVDNTFQYNTNLTWTRGNHVFKFGGGVVHRNFEATQSQFPDANYVFDSTPTRVAGAGGNAFASLLTGFPTTSQRNLSLIAPYYGTYEDNAYAQDNWRAKPWLTLNLGVRWDLFTPWTERHNLLSNFNPTTGLLQQASASDPTAQIQTYYHDFAPRVGFAATIGHGMVLRGGFGTTFFPARYASFFQLKNPPLASSFSAPYTNAANSPTLTTALSAPTPLPASGAACPTAPPPAAFNPATCPSQQINAVAPNWRASYVYQTSLQLQKEFAGNVIGIGYVGEFGRALSVLVDLNQLAPPGPGAALFTGGNTRTNQPYYAQYPRIQVISQAVNAGMSHYHGLQLTYDRRIRSGLTVSANYTYSHEIDDAIYPGFGFYPSCRPGLQCPVDNGNGTTHTVNGLNYEEGNGSYNLPNRWVAAINYQLPFGKNASGAEKYLIQGWQFNTLASWSSGLPIPIQEANNAVLSDVAATGGNTPGGRPNRAGSLNVANGVATPSGVPWINLSGMTAQTVGTLGNLGRDVFAAPPLRHWDMSLFKDFRVTEGMRLQFRYEVFNVTNTANFSAPVATIAAFTGGTTGAPTNTGGFGTITSTAANATPRQMQFALKLLF